MMRKLVTLGVLLVGSAVVWAAGKEEQVAKYITDLKSKDAGVRATAAEEIGRIGEIQAAVAKPAIKPLLDVLQDKDAKVRAAAADALGRLDAPAEVVPAMIQVLKDDKNEKVRARAATSLGLMGAASKEALPTLREIAQKEKDKNKMLARACGEAAREISGRGKKN
jgi:HEAT repeat protein